MLERAERIRNRWMKECTKMRKWCMELKKHPKSKLYLTKLSAQDNPDIREKIIEIYLKACHFYHIQLYFKWRVVHHEECLK